MLQSNKDSSADITPGISSVYNITTIIARNIKLEIAKCGGRDPKGDVARVFP